MARCSICYTVLRDAEPVTACPDCRQDYHKTCWDEIGGCGTYGCKQAAVAQKPPPVPAAHAGWGDSKACPDCTQQIPSAWLACRCGARFPWADPMLPQEYREWQEGVRDAAGARTALTWMFILSLTVVLSPVTGLIGGTLAYAKRKRLASDGTFLAMGYGSAALGVLFTLLIVVTTAGA